MSLFFTQNTVAELNSGNTHFYKTRGNFVGKRLYMFWVPHLQYHSELVSEVADAVKEKSQSKIFFLIPF